MEEKPTSKLAAATPWVSLVMAFLGVLEKFLPAFFVAWNNALRQKNAELSSKLKLNEVQKQVEQEHAKVIEKHAGKTDRDVLDDFLGK